MARRGSQGAWPRLRCARRRDAKRRGLAAVVRHCVVGFDRDDSSFRSVGAKGPFTREAFRLRCDDELAQIAALRVGGGIGGCREGVARRQPDLIPVLPGAARFALEMRQVMHEDLKATPPIRLLFDALAAGLADDLRGRSLFELHPHVGRWRPPDRLVEDREGEKEERATPGETPPLAESTIYISSANASCLVSWRRISGVCATAKIRVKGKTPKDLNVTH